MCNEDSHFQLKTRKVVENYVNILMAQNIRFAPERFIRANFFTNVSFIRIRNRKLEGADESIELMRPP